MNTQYFDCKCGDFNHAIRFNVDEEGEVWLTVRLNPHQPWYRRVKDAFWYILGVEKAYGNDGGGHWDVTLLDKGDTMELIDLLLSSMGEEDLH